MSYGIEILDAQGNVAISMTHRTTRVWGEWTFHSATIPSEHILSLPEVSQDGSWFAYAAATDYDEAPGIYFAETIHGTGFRIRRAGMGGSWANFKVFVFRA